MILHPEPLSPEAEEFKSDPENYFRTIVVPRLKDALGLDLTEEEVRSFLAPIKQGEDL